MPFSDILERAILTADEAVPLLVQLLGSLSALHAQGSGHGGLHPHNVFLNADGSIRIGPAQGAAPEAYQAPEVKAGGAATEQSDLWFVGALAFECMTGIKLSVQLAKSAVLNYPIEALHWVPSEVRDVISRLSAVEPGARFENAETAAFELEKLMAGKPAQPPRVLQALMRPVANMQEMQIVLSRETSKSMVKRALFIAASLQIQNEAGKGIASVPGQPLTVDQDIARAAVAQMRGPKVEVVKPAPAPRIQVEPVHVVPAGRRLPAVEIMLGILILAGGAFLWRGQKIMAVVKSTLEGPKTAQQPQTAAPGVSYELPQIVPTNPTSFWLRDLEPVMLSWGEDVQVVNTYVQLSRTQSFSGYFIEEPVSGRGHRVRAKLEEGKYYWRLWNRSSGKSVGPFEFTVAFAEAPLILSPNDGQNFVIPPTFVAIEKSFSWQCKPGATMYEAVLRDSFGKTLAQKQTPDCSWNDVQLTRGEYSLAVRVMAPDSQHNVFGDPTLFTVRGGTADPMSRFKSKASSDNSSYYAEPKTRKFPSRQPAQQPAHRKRR